MDHVCQIIYKYFKSADEQTRLKIDRTVDIIIEIECVSTIVLAWFEASIVWVMKTTH